MRIAVRTRHTRRRPSAAGLIAILAAGLSAACSNPGTSAATEPRADGAIGSHPVVEPQFAADARTSDPPATAAPDAADVRVIAGDGPAVSLDSRAGAGGAAATDAGADALGDASPGETLCAPKIVFLNKDPQGKGKAFDTLLPDPTPLLQDAVRRVCAVLYRHPSEVRTIPTVTFVVTDLPMGIPAETSGATTSFSAAYAQQLVARGKNAATEEIRGVSVHEFSHIYQNVGPGYAGNWVPVVEGMADFVRFEAGLIPLSNRHKGGAWNDSYQTTAFFLAWVDQQYPDFGYKFNQSLTSKDKTWPPVGFVAITGKTVDALWAAYQASL